MTDANRMKEVEAANKQLAASRAVLEKARAAANMSAETYSPFSPSYPKTSTGRRTALAEWITDRSNPLTAPAVSGALMQADLARHMGVGRAAMGSLIDGLEAGAQGSRAQGGGSDFV